MPKVSSAVSVIGSSDRRLHNARETAFETLEPRTLLSATLTTAIAPQSLAASQAVSVPLASHFNDPSLTPGDTIVDMQVNLPAPANHIPIQLTNAATPVTVAFFLKYISSGEYANTLLHRLLPGFILQGGGYTADGQHIKTSGNIPDESSTETLQNTAGTIATALSNGPGTATSDFFFNLGDNRSTLDGTADGGPFTVFGKVIYSGMKTLTTINGLSVVSDQQSSVFSNLPVQHYTGASGISVPSVPAADLIEINPVVVPGGLNYSVTSSSTAIVKATISNGSLSLTGVSAGTATITVTATDLGGGKATSKFTVTVQKATTIAGQVFSDTNGNGKLDTGEPGLAGVKVYIDANKNGKLDTGEVTTTTDSTGKYAFSGLTAGTYRIEEVLPSGYRLTGPTAGFYDVKTIAGTTVTAGNFLDAPAPATEL
jgi:peptidyl-prolyl cis-trans isomerase A (cyclophilin A)